MSDLLIKLLRICLPVPKRMFDFWVGLFADIVKAALLAVVPYLWFGEGSLAIRVFIGCVYSSFLSFPHSVPLLFATFSTALFEGETNWTDHLPTFPDFSAFGFQLLDFIQC